METNFNATLVLGIGNLGVKLMENAGPLVVMELYMRLLVMLKPEVKQSLIAITKNANVDLWDCKLEHIEKALLVVYAKEFDKPLKEKFTFVRLARNKLIHGDFAGLLNLSESEKKAPQITYTNPAQEANAMVRNLTNSDFLRVVRIKANEIVSVLERIINPFQSN